MQQETGRSHPNTWYDAASDQRRRGFVAAAEMRKGDQTRQEIIREAAPIFNQHGYEGAALSDLMKATGWKRAESTAFRKQAAGCGRAFDTLGTGDRHAFEGTQEISNTVDRFEADRAELSDRRAGLCRADVLCLTRQWIQRWKSPIEIKAQRALNSWLERLRGIIDEGKSKGEIRKECQFLRIGDTHCWDTRRELVGEPIAFDKTPARIWPAAI